MSMLSVANEITYCLWKDGCRPICQSCIVEFISEIAEGVFVLSNNQRDTRDFRLADNLEIEADAHEVSHDKEHETRKALRRANVFTSKGVEVLHMGIVPICLQ